MAPMTRDQQVKTVVEGLALGVIAVGVDAVTSSKLDLEFAISHALHDWSYARSFPSLSGLHGSNYVWIGIRKSERRRNVFAAWADGRSLEPYITMDGWSVKDCTDILAKTGPVRHDGWIELAEPFVADLGEAKVRRT